MFDAAEIPLFYQIAALLVLAAAGGLLGVLLRQPLVVIYIAVGIVAGPSALGIADTGEAIELLAQLGVALLLFLVGLKLDIGLVRSVGPVALATGLGQVAFTALIGFLICLGLKLDWLSSLYVAVALTFSSTIIIVKLLSDKGEIGSLHGRIALGFLIVQDIVVVLAMVGLSSFGIQADPKGAPLGLVEMSLALLGMLIGLGLFMRYLADPFVERLAKSPELLVAFGIGWAAVLAALGDYLGFGKELGGLIAGISLASTPYREALSTRLTSLRDFLLLFFFIELGAGLQLGELASDIPSAIALSLFVLIGNPLIVLIIMGAMGYRRRTGFLAGLTVAQISEFSLIFIAMGASLGHVDERTLGLVTVVGLVTIAASVYMILYSHTLYRWLASALAPFERKTPWRESTDMQGTENPSQERYDIILLGLGRYGGTILQLLRAQKFRVLGVDFNPQAVHRWRQEGVQVLYGDISDPDFVASLPFHGVRWVVSAIPEHDLALGQTDPRVATVQILRSQGYSGRTAVAAHRQGNVERLRANGVDVVFIPFRDAAERAVELLMGAHRREELEIIEPEAQKELQGSP